MPRYFNVEDCQVKGNNGFKVSASRMGFNLFNILDLVLLTLKLDMD